MAPGPRLGRGGPAADLDALVAAVVAVSTLASELGDVVGALEVNPRRCGPFGAAAPGVLVEVTGAGQSAAV